ncbi:hypothetical protein OIU77_007970 [Salix suchowensis]|uniref:Uncharacterized protein n=1 Tax=Salix suchowensis TaxID=1278906 RepID=A0ABQ9AJD5_9ROSI|nr:hypothetical protein OIU77_007970 [Salix suchowensis]
MSIEAYLAKIKGITDQFAAISQPVPDSELVKRTLRGLPHTLEYQPFAQDIANIHTPISFTELRARLLVHEQELERIRGRATPPLSSPAHHAFVTQQHYQPSRNPPHGNYRRFKRPKQDHAIVVAAKYTNRKGTQPPIAITVIHGLIPPILIIYLLNLLVFMFLN